MTEQQIEETKARIVKFKKALENRFNADNARVVNKLAEDLYIATGLFYSNDEWLCAR